ncbi:MAG TPA: carboxypeptidase-like regulatory domain-containing protein [Thermoanaerobaculia bacterium]|nr:carboxypeptidase-like regulatory domain-containing protein [Thermoanaerobaculia bacterium]
MNAARKGGVFVYSAIVLALILAATITGSVVLDDAPLPGCTVHLGAQSVVTDIDGRYAIFGVPDGKQTVELDLPGLKADPITITVAGRDLDLGARPMKSVATDCSMTIKFCREQPPRSIWDHPICSEADGVTALLQAKDYESLRASYLVTESIPERIRVAGALLGHISGDAAMWQELEGYARAAVRHPRTDSELAPAFITWSEKRGADPWLAWNAVNSALLAIAEDPRSRALLVEALATSDEDLVATAVYGLAAQHDDAALPAIERAIRRFEDRGMFTEMLRAGDDKAQALADKFGPP